MCTGEVLAQRLTSVTLRQPYRQPAEIVRADTSMTHRMPKQPRRLASARRCRRPRTGHAVVVTTFVGSSSVVSADRAMRATIGRFRDVDDLGLASSGAWTLLSRGSLRSTVSLDGELAGHEQRHVVMRTVR